MKKTLLCLFALISFSLVNATNYYISSSSGDDNNDGRTSLTAWKSISKLNSAMNSLLPGDSVLFKCNDTFWGQIIVSKSGNSSKCIYFGSYGAGSKPIISGKTTVSNWIQSSPNIWQATCSDCSSKVTNFFINDIPQQIGRWPNVTEPNKGYRTYTSHSGTTKIIDNNLSDAINWTGAEAIVRSVRWELNRFTIKSQNKGTLEFTSAIGFSFLDGFGYFIQNDPRTLDQQGEWFFNPSNKQFAIFSKTDPNTFITKATNCNNLINLNGVTYITIENLHFDGASTVAIYTNNCSNIVFNNNEVWSSGINGVEAHSSDFIKFENNIINKTNNDALFISESHHSTIRNNIIKNTASVAGMGLSQWHYLGAYVTGNNNLIEYNTIDSVGYNGMIFNGDSVLIQNNIISNFCMVKDDGGAFYTSGSDNQKSRKLISNIVYNGIGAPEGSGWPGVAAQGIYMDEGAPNVDILNNTVFNCSDNGIVIHNSNHINVKGNNVYNNGTQLYLQHDVAERPILSCVIDSNNFVSKLAVQEIVELVSSFNNIRDFGSFDYNQYCKPFDTTQIIYLDYFNGTNNTSEVHALKSWSLQYNKDLHSGESPIAVIAYTVNSVNSSNYISNGTFDSNINGWNSWSPYNNNKITFALSAGQAGGALHAEFTSSSGQSDGYMYIISNNIAFSTDKTYRLRFAARSKEAGTILQMIPRKNDTPYNQVADIKVFSIDTTYKEYEYVFTPNLNEPIARIDFQLPESKGDLWFDNIELVEVDITKTNPDDYIRFEYNATKNDKSISLTDTMLDVRGIPVSGNIVLKPFSSIILFKNLSNGIKPARPDTIKGDLTVCPGSVITYSIVPIPNATYYSWELPNGWKGTSTTYDITATAGDTGGIISVTAINVSDSSIAQTINVVVDNSITPIQPKAINGNTNICAGTTNIYSIAIVSGAKDYTWKLPDGWTGLSTSNSITAMADATGGNITVTANNGCGSSVAQTLSITTNPIPANPVISLDNGILQSNTINGNQWYFNNNKIGDATNVTYVPTLQGNYYVILTLNGCSSQHSNVISFNPTGIDETVDAIGINMHPNPTTGIVKIFLNNTFNSDYSVDIYDIAGSLIQTLKKGQSEVSFEIDLGKYSAGVYLVRIYNLENNFQTKLIKR